MKGPQSGPCIEVIQEKATEELEEIRVERSTKEVLHYTLQCIQGTEAFQDISSGYRVEQSFSFSVASFSNNWCCEGSQQAGETGSSYTQ